MRPALRMGLGLMAVLAAADGSVPAELSATATAPRPVVVELFTSQGCSSCPPAEAVFGRLTGRPGVLGLAFHVDYWDNGSWRDRFSIPQATPRQQAYVHGLGLSTAFTPQAVVDGRWSVVGSNEAQLQRALIASTDHVDVKLELAGAALRVDLPAAQGADADVTLVAYLSSASTAVGGGENSGRRLTEFNIVRQIAALGAWTGTARSFSLPRSSLPSDADRAAVLVQEHHQGRILGASAIALQ